MEGKLESEMGDFSLKLGEVALDFYSKFGGRQKPQCNGNT